MAANLTKTPNVVAVGIAGRNLVGWLEVSITMRAQAFPNQFEVRATSPDGAGAKLDVPAHAGDACTISIDGDKVVTGYIDRVEHSASPADHGLSLIGRGKTQDLVDCSAEWPSGQLVNGDVVSIATKLAQPYGITVKLGADAEAGPQVPTTLLNYGETGSELIQRYARNAGLLAYENARGELVLNWAGSERAASGIAYGSNIINLLVSNSVEQRYSDIVCQRLATDTLIELGEGGFEFYRASDPNIRRHRLMYITLDAGPGGEDFTERRAIWESSRRLAHSYTVQATVDSWRDSAGALWRPNTLVPVKVPGLDIAASELILTEVTFRQSSEAGTTAEMVLMPPKGLVPEPIQLITAAIAELHD